MDIISTTIGSYPRPEWFREYLRRLEGLQKEGKKEIERDRYRDALAQVMNEQLNSGIRLFTDGQLIWQDFLCYLCTKIEGFEMSGLIRYFDNNVYYRMPVAKEKLERNKDIILEEFKLAKEIQPETKAVISCFTIAELSKDEFYGNKKEFVMAIADIMNREAKKLAENGARYIQIDEPSLLNAKKEDLEIAREAVKVIRRGIEAKFFLATYFRDAERIFPEILEFPVDVIGLDFVEGYEKNLELLNEYRIEKEIQAGIVDGRNTKMESSEEVRKKIDNIIDRLNTETLYISPNTGLEFLPYQKASEKLRVMCNSIDHR